MDPVKLMRNLIRVGKINSVDPSKGTVDVLFEDKDNYIASDLPLPDFEYNMPEIGEQALCIFLGNGLEQGFCLRSFYSEINPPPARDKYIYKKQLDNSTYVEYNKQTKGMKVKIDEVQMDVQNGKVIIKADEILLGDEAGEGIPLGGQLKEWLDSHQHDISSLKSAFDNHTHEHSWTNSGGSGTTSTPSQSFPSNTSESINESPVPSARVKLS